MQQTNNQLWVNDLLNRLEFTMPEQMRFMQINFMQSVCYLLKWDEDQYTQFQHNCGRNYLIYMTNNDEAIIAELEANKLFWNWWKQNWVLRDEAYCIPDLAMQTKAIRFDMYLSVHDAKHLAHEIYPEGKMLGKGYASMIGKIIKQQ